MSAENYLTITKDDPRFYQLLHQGIYQGKRAIPVRSLNVATEKEQITFELTEYPPKPASIWQWIESLIRPQWLIMSLGPVVVTWTYLWTLPESLPGWIVFAGIISLVFFCHLGIFFLNDYQDYIQGVDRWSHGLKRNPLVHGWLRPVSLRLWGQVFVGLALINGCLLLWYQWQISVGIAGLLLFLGVLGFSNQRLGVKPLGLGEAFVFFSLGPVLVLGVSDWAAGVWDHTLFLFSIFSGHAAVLCLELRQLQNIMADSEAGYKTFAVRLGFDRAKLFILFQMILHILFLAAICVSLTNMYLFVVIGMVYVFLVSNIASNLWKSPSPLSSHLEGLYLKISLSYGGFCILLSSMFIWIS